MNLKTRIVHTHDTEENWNKCINFIPAKGEMIVYDIDDTHEHERFKIGDGKTLIIDLPFAVDTLLDNILNTKDGVHYIDGGRIGRQ